METPDRPASESSRFGRRVPWVMAFFFVGLAAFLAPRISPYAAGADSSGYLNSARLLSAGKFTAPVRSLPGVDPLAFGPAAYMPLGFLVQQDGTHMAPTYPIGLPLHLCAASVFGWDRAVTVVNLGALLAAGLLTYLTGLRLALPPAFAAGASILWWSCPLTIFASAQPMSDLLATAWASAALYAAIRSGEAARWSLATGLAVGIAVLVRPTNVLLAIPVAVAFGPAWRRYGWCIVGGLPSAILLLCYNHALYGSPFRTGYGDTEEMFAAQWVPQTLAHYARWLPVLLGPLVVMAAAAPFLKFNRTRSAAVLGAWLATLTGVYAMYYHTHETWWYLRFVLPAFPAVILFSSTVLAAYCLRAADGKRRLTSLGVAVVALIFSLSWMARETGRLGALDVHESESKYAASAEWARANLPPDGVVLALQLSGAFYYYTDLIVARWDQIDGRRIGEFRSTVAVQQRQLFAALYEFEQENAQQRIGGTWEKLAVVGDTTFWRIESPAANP